MKANCRGGFHESYYTKVLIFDRFTAVGATLEQVKAIFAASKFTVLSFNDIVVDDEIPM
jgi:hypothetical protein